MEEPKVSVLSFCVLGMHISEQLLTGPECGGKRLLL
jgi:hypothetical protein